MLLGFGEAYSTFYNQLFTVVVEILLLAIVKALVPLMMKTEKANVRFGIGVTLLVIYTVVMLVVFRFFTLDAENIEDCLARVAVAFVIMNAVVLFTAVLYYISRDKRKMSEMDRMKLKDM